MVTAQSTSTGAPRAGLRCAGCHRSCPRVQPFYLLDLLASGRSLGSSYEAGLNPQPLAFRLGNSLHWGSQGPLGRPAPERKQLVTLKIRPTMQRSTSLVAAQHAKIKSTICTTQNSAPPVLDLTQAQRVSSTSRVERTNSRRAEACLELHWRATILIPLPSWRSDSACDLFGRFLLF